MTTKFVVDSIHISVVCGDAAIHLLVEEGGYETPKIHGAVLIDGGDQISDDNGPDKADLRALRQKVEKHSILSTIEWIEWKYDCNNATKKLQFDSIVITHWDKDHYDGIGNVLADEAAKALQAGTRISWLKWDGDKPKTYCYAPTTLPSEKLPSRYFSLQDDPDEQGQKIIYSKTRHAGQPKEYAFARFRSTGATDNNGPAGLWDVLGVNLFTNTFLGAQSDTISLDELLEKNPPGDQRPAFYCVGVRRSCLEKSSWTWKKEDSTTHGKDPHVVPDTKPTVKNRNSIAAIVAWKGSGGSSARVSHYVAGDLGQNQEQQILNWLKSGKVNRITSIKASHHGAYNGTPIDMLDDFQPLNTYVPTPTKPVHGHPSWELLLVWNLYAMTKSTQDVITRSTGPRLICATYPPYIFITANGNYQKPLPLTNLEHKKFKEAFKAKVDAVNNKRQNAFPILNDIESVQARTTGRAEYLADRVAQILWTSAFPTSQYHAALSSAHELRTGQPAWKALHLVMIQSRNDAEKDGMVHYKDMGSRQLHRLPMIDRQSANSSTELPTAAHPATAVKRKIDPPPTVPQRPRASRLSKAEDRETDDSLLGVVKVPQGTFHVFDETNPDEMRRDGDEDDSDVLSSKIETISSQTDRQMTVKPSLSAEGYYIFSSDIPETDIEVEEYEILEPGALDSFVEALHCGVICLEEAPTEPGTLVALEGADEWGCWFNDVLGVYDLSVMVGEDDGDGGGDDGDGEGSEGEVEEDDSEDGGDGEDGDEETIYPIGGFAMQVPLVPIGSDAKPESTILAFTTDPAVLEQTFGSTEYLSEIGLLTESSVLVFGLSEVVGGSASVAINELIQFIGLRDWFNDADTGENISPIMAVLGMLEVTIPSSGSQPDRNAIWFAPGDSYKTTVRLALPLNAQGETELNDFLDVFKISLSEVTVIARRSSAWSTTGEDVVIQTQGSLTLRATATVNGSIALDAVLQFNPTVTTIILTNSMPSAVSLSAILAWVAAIVGVGPEHFDFTNLQGKQTGSVGLGDFEFRRIILHLDKDSSRNDEPVISSFTLDAEVNVSFGDVPVLFLLTYAFDHEDGNTVRARLWGKPPFTPGEDGQNFLPDYEDLLFLAPITATEDELHPTLSLSALGDLGTPPSFLPDEVLQAEFIGNQQGLYFTGTLVSKEPDENDPVPIFTVSEITLEIFYDWGQSAPVARVAGPGFSGGFYAKALITQPEGSTYGSPTQLTGAVTYDSGEWQLYGSMDHFFASTLAQFFSKDVEGAVIPMIESIEVRDFEVLYAFGGEKGRPSSFSISAGLVIDMHIFALSYSHHGTEWDFTATMKPDQNPSVVSNAGNILTSLTGSDLQLPDFLVNIFIPTEPDDFVEFSIKKAQLAGTQRESVIVIATWVVNNRVFQFIQFRQTPPPGITTPGPLRRIVIASLTKFPSITLPMLGDVSQPFDQAMFLWAQAEGGEGIPRGELLSVNELLVQSPGPGERPKPTVPFKSLVKKDDETDADIVLTNGLHFMVVAFTTASTLEVIIDYTFTNPKRPGTRASPGDTDQGGRMEPFAKSIGALSIKNIGLKYSTGLYGNQSILSVRMDASTMVGPIEFALVGFSIDFDFSNDGASLHHPPTPGFSLEGLATAFDRAPIQIGGVLQIGKEIDREYYQGALTVSYIPWQFQAAGYWGKTRQRKLSDKEFETVFVYCLLRGPLITFQFVSIEGICGGFGLNSSLQFPTPKNLLDFPLIMDGNNTPPAEGSPLDALESLLDTSWFFPRDKSFWVAAGLTVKAFEILSVQAVVVIQWNPYVELGIFGLATASIPGGRSQWQFAHVQLGIVATVNFETGILKIEGELTPSSYILDPSCHLTGGFALYSWFDSSDSKLRGDWVFTIGGYHPAYKKPPQYPDVARLGISWQFGKSISITGNSYFAITPKTCMGGGKWDVKLSLNPLYAWFNAFVDFLINYKPFYFLAEGGVSVGVQFTLDLWLVTIKIKVELSARLYIEGPPIRGTVYVNFWVFGFDIDFGKDGSSGSQPLSLNQFIELVCQSNTPGAKGILQSSNAGQDRHIYSVEEGLVPKGDIASTPNEDIWIVHAATFTFSVNCKFAIEAAEIQTRDVQGNLQDPVDRVEGSQIQINARPMHTTGGISSKLTVSIKPKEQQRPEWLSTEPMWNDNEAIYSDVPVALWGKYDASSDPARQKNPTALLNGTSEKTMNLMTGVRINRPKAVYAEDTTKPYNIELFQLASLDPDPIPTTPERPTELEGMPWAESGTEPEEQWETVRDTWNSRASAAEEAVSLWRQLGLDKLGWDEERIKGSDSAFTASKPQKLIDNLEKHYLWSPLLSCG